MNRRLLMICSSVLVVLLSPAGWAQSEAQEAIAMSCGLGFLEIESPSGEVTNAGFRASLSLAVGESLFPGYARLLLTDFAATIPALPAFADVDADGLVERVLLDPISVSYSQTIWVHGGIHLATGDFILYLHLLVPNLYSQGIVAFEPQYVRLVLCGTLRPGRTSLSVTGTGIILSEALAGTALTLRVRCSLD